MDAHTHVTTMVNIKTPNMEVTGLDELSKKLFVHLQR